MRKASRETNSRYCEDCVHFKDEREGYCGNRVRSPIDGEMKSVAALLMRMNEGFCGMGGKNWEPKK